MFKKSERGVNDPFFFGAIALSYPPRVRVRATAKLSAAFFHDKSSITIGGVRKCNSTFFLSPGVFKLVTLLAIAKFHPGNSAKFYCTPLEILSPKTRTTGNSTLIFLINSGDFTFF